MPVLDNYLFFNGNCAEAMRFYERVLGAKIELMMTYADAPAQEGCPAGSADRIMHANLRVGDRALMASDTPETFPHNGMNGFSLSLGYGTTEEARRIFDALSEGGKVTMPMQKTFWAEAYGMFTDRFGTPWMVGGGVHG